MAPVIYFAYFSTMACPLSPSAFSFPPTFDLEVLGKREGDLVENFGRAKGSLGIFSTDFLFSIAVDLSPVYCWYTQPGGQRGADGVQIAAALTSKQEYLSLAVDALSKSDQEDFTRVVGEESARVLVNGTGASY